MTTAIAKVEPVSLLHHLERDGLLTPVSLDLSDPELSFQTWAGLVDYLGQIKLSTSWWIGDALNFGEATYGEKYAQATALTGLREQTLMNYAYVCRQVPKARRREGVSFSAHAEVAPLPPREQRHWLALAAEHGWHQKELRAAMREAGVKPDKGEQPSWTPSGREVTDVARAILTQAQSDGNGYYRVPSELIARLGSALGEEE